MPSVTISATASDSTTGTSSGTSYIRTIDLETSTKKTVKATSTEAAFSFGEVAAPSVLVVHCLSLVDTVNGDPSHKLYWGLATGDLPYELLINESSQLVIRSDVPSPTNIYFQSEDAATDFWVSYAVWDSDPPSP